MHARYETLILRLLFTNKRKAKKPIAEIYKNLEKPEYNDWLPMQTPNHPTLNFNPFTQQQSFLAQQPPVVNLQPVVPTVPLQPAISPQDAELKTKLDAEITKHQELDAQITELHKKITRQRNLVAGLKNKLGKLDNQLQSEDKVISDEEIEKQLKFMEKQRNVQRLSQQKLQLEHDTSLLSKNILYIQEYIVKQKQQQQQQNKEAENELKQTGNELENRIQNQKAQFMLARNHRITPKQTTESKSETSSMGQRLAQFYTKRNEDGQIFIGQLGYTIILVLLFAIVAGTLV